MFHKTPGFRVFFWFFTVAIGIFVFFPLLWMINTALKPTAETFTLDFFTGTKTLDNIIHIVTDEKIMRYLRNSLIVSFGSSAMATIVCAFAAYSFYCSCNTGYDYLYLPAEILYSGAYLRRSEGVEITEYSARPFTGFRQTFHGISSDLSLDFAGSLIGFLYAEVWKSIGVIYGCDSCQPQSDWQTRS